MKKEKIIIIGAGFAGVYTARHLRKKLKDSVDIELINANNYFVFQPLLPEVASGTLSAQDAVVPLRALAPGVKVRQAEVIGIDQQKQCVQLLQGSRHTVIPLEYDHLILTAGQEANCSLVQGMDNHAFTIKNLSDAYQIRNHILQCLEWADVTISAETKKRLLTFVVAGGGFSGVETMGEIVEMIHRALRYYPNIDKTEIKPIIIQAGDRLLPELHEKLGEYTARKFKQRGIEVVLNARVNKMTGTVVILDDARLIPCSTLVSSIGNKSPRFIASLNLELNRGKVSVDQHLKVRDCQNIWALGDIAAIPMNAEATEYAPPTAQFAVAEAETCANNIANQINNRPLNHFSFKPRGSLASLGSYSGVGEVFGIKLSGIIGWFVWRGFYILKIPGFATKIRITLNWLYDYFLPRNIVYLQQSAASSLKEMHFMQGDVMFHKGQYLDALYIVKSGKCEISDGKGFRREFGPGDHFGERLIETNHPLTGEFIAIEDSVILMFEKSQFSALRDSLPILDDYFNSLNENKYSPEVRKNSS